MKTPSHTVTGAMSMSGLYHKHSDTAQLTRSIIVPFYNEEACVVGVLEEIRKAQPAAEIIAVDDGSTDQTWQRISTVAGVTGLRFLENRGQSAAMYAGLLHASGEVCVLMDGDGQNDPADIEALVSKLAQADIVCGYRATRKDTWSRRVASRIANAIRRLFLDDGVRDTGCSLKAFPRPCVELLVPFNGLHRYLPAIFKKAGLKIAEVPVNHRARSQGVSKYTNWNRAIRGIYDLIGVAWLLNRKIRFPKTELRATAKH
ncbi:MAG: glycosyltransferase family 2 protein [Opitutales bacterium]|nr:glycosyltransferase family 2 protein [Opitutales bacterium]